MKTLKLSAFILAAALFMGFGATTISASEKSVQSEKLTINGKVCNFDGNCKCEKCDCAKDKSACTCQKCECGMKKGPKAVMKCGAGKCGAANTPPNAVMKCGAGKGSNN